MLQGEPDGLEMKALNEYCRRCVAQGFIRLHVSTPVRWNDKNQDTFTPVFPIAVLRDAAEASTSFQHT